MAIYNGRYKWDGTKTDDREPIAWSPGAYDVKIFEFVSTGNVQHLKSHVCVYARTGKGHSISAKPESFAKRICHDFSLEMERVLWIEDHLTDDDDRYEIVTFTPTSKVGKHTFYRTDKRKAHEREINMVQREMAVV